jgi:serine/threonine-protein kinase RsbW
LKLEITNGPAALEQIHAALEAFWRKHEQVPQHIRNEISIATGEIAANILEHARAVTVWMELHARPDAIEIEFTDGGDPIDIDLDAASMPDAMAESGRGLALAQAALRLLSYFRDEVGNHGRLVSNAFSPGRQRSDSAEDV